MLLPAQQWGSPFYIRGCSHEPPLSDIGGTERRYSCRCPLREPDVGKTTIANAAMSVLGIEACTFRGMRREFFVHLASQTSLGLMYDDPNKVQEVENIIVDFYNGMTRGSFKRGLETPRCGFLLACNFSLVKIQR